jgi:hypothetical protein
MKWFWIILIGVIMAVSTFAMFGAVINVEGDKMGCRKYLGEANRMLHQMRNLNKTGVFALPERKYDDGTVIKVNASNGRDYVHIYKPTGSVVTEKLTRRICVPAYAVFHQDGTGKMWARYNYSGDIVPSADNPSPAVSKLVELDGSAWYPFNQARIICSDKLIPKELDAKFEECEDFKTLFTPTWQTTSTLVESIDETWPAIPEAGRSEHHIKSRTDSPLSITRQANDTTATWSSLASQHQASWVEARCPHPLSPSGSGDLAGYTVRGGNGYFLDGEDEVPYGTNTYMVDWVTNVDEYVYVNPKGGFTKVMLYTIANGISCGDGSSPLNLYGSAVGTRTDDYYIRINDTVKYLGRLTITSNWNGVSGYVYNGDTFDNLFFGIYLRGNAVTFVLSQWHKPEGESSVYRVVYGIAKGPSWEITTIDRDDETMYVPEEDWYYDPITLGGKQYRSLYELVYVKQVVNE